MDDRQLRDGLERARKAGARGAELLYEHTGGARWTITRGKPQAEDRPPEERVSVRVWVEGGGVGFRAGAPDALDGLIAKALKEAGRSKADRHAGPIGRQQTVLGGLGILDRRHDAVTDEDRVEILATAERSVKAIDRRLTGSQFVYTDAKRLRRFANSRGVFLVEEDTVYTAEGRVATPSGRDAIALGDRIASRTFASIASIPFATNLARRAADLLQPAVDLEGPVRALLAPHVVARLFAAMAERFVAASFEDGGAFFLRPTPPGRTVVDPRLHLQDDGTLPGGLHTRSFDDRGACPVPLTLLREGKVDGRFVDPEHAHVLDARPTGHVCGTGQAPTNLLLRSGTRSMNAALVDLGGTVLALDDLDPAEVDLATGEVDAKVNGVVLEANEPAGAVRRARLRGNLLTVLNSVVEVCSDTDRIGHVDAPGMVVDGFSLESR